MNQEPPRLEDGSERLDRWQERQERRQERREMRQRRPLGSIFGALVLIWLGVVFLLAQNSEILGLGPLRVTWENMWAVFLAGLGALLILEAILRAILPGYGFGITSRLIWGVALLLLGLAGILPGMNWRTVWPVILIVLGVGLLLNNLIRR